MSEDLALQRARDRAFEDYGTIERLEFGGGQLTVSINSRIDKPVGLIGDITLPTDDAAADALLNTAIGWCQVRGCSQVIAGVTRNTWYPFRIVVDGFESFSQFSGEPWNAPDLAERLVSRGFDAVARYESTWGGDSSQFLDGAGPKISAAVARGYRIRPFDPRQAVADLEFVHSVILEAFQPPENYLFHPISFDEFRLVLGPSVRGLDPGLLLLATGPSGDRAGFIYATPEGSDAVSIKTLAVVPGHRSTGLGAALAALIHRASNERARPRLIHALMRTGNHSAAISGTAGYEVLRRYAVFGRSIEPLRT